MCTRACMCVYVCMYVGGCVWVCVSSPLRLLILYSAIIQQEQIDNHSVMFYLPVLPLPLIFSVDTYVDNLALEQGLELSNCCYICPYFRNYLPTSNILGDS